MRNETGHPFGKLEKSHALVQPSPWYRPPCFTRGQAASRAQGANDDGTRPVAGIAHAGRPAVRRLHAQPSRRLLPRGLRHDERGNARRLSPSEDPHRAQARYFLFVVRLFDWRNKTA